MDKKTNGLLLTLHSRRGNMSLALPYLAAVLKSKFGEPGPRIVESCVTANTDELLARLLDNSPSWLGFSCYPWNADILGSLALGLRQSGFDGPIIFGGPEIAHIRDKFLPLLKNGAWVVQGEGEATLPELLHLLFSASGNSQALPSGTSKWIEGRGIVYGEKAVTPKLKDLPSPFAMGLIDLNRPFVYLEASRGCPFKCEFCLFSLTDGVRWFPLDRILADLEILIASPVQNVMFVDRTFNIDPVKGAAIVSFLLEKAQGMQFQFEVYPEYLPDELRDLFKEAPAGMFQLEVGIQTTGGNALKRVQRKANFEKAISRLEPFLIKRNVRIHCDMIIGLPGEGKPEALQTLGDLIHTAPHSLQINTLKLLPGTALRERSAEIELSFAKEPPHEICAAPWLSSKDLEHLKTVRRLVYIYYNSKVFQKVIFALSTWAFPDGGSLFDSMAHYWKKMKLPLWGMPQEKAFEVLAGYMDEIEDASRPAQTTGAVCAGREVLRHSFLKVSRIRKSLPRFLYPAGERELWSVSGQRRPISVQKGKLSLGWGIRVERYIYATWRNSFLPTRWGSRKLPAAHPQYVLYCQEKNRSLPPSVTLLDDNGAMANFLWKYIVDDGSNVETGQLLEEAKRQAYLVS